MIRALIAALLRFIHSQELLLRLAERLESAPIDTPAEPVGESNGGNAESVDT